MSMIDLTPARAIKPISDYASNTSSYVTAAGETVVTAAFAKRAAMTPELKATLGRLLRMPYRQLIESGPHDLRFDMPVDFVPHAKFEGWQSAEPRSVAELRDPSVMIRYDDGEIAAWVILVALKPLGMYLGYVLADSMLGDVFGRRHMHVEVFGTDTADHTGFKLLIAPESYRSETVEVRGTRIAVATMAVSHSDPKTMPNFVDVWGDPNLDRIDAEIAETLANRVIETGRVRATVAPVEHMR
jgi:hypothetical protein